MESRSHGAGRHLTVSVVVLLAAVVMPAGTARADSPHSSVSTNDDGVRIEIDRSGPGQGNGSEASARPRSRARSRARPGAPTCRLVRVPASRHLTPRFANGDLSRALTPFSVVCNGRVVGVIWLDRSGGRRPAAAALSEQLVHDIPLPVAGIRTSPAARGLTGLETWFWVDGYDGHPVTATVRALGTIVEVEATPIAYHWDFGDGTQVVDGDLGRPAPERSTVAHTYDGTATGPGFAVLLQFEFAVRYRVDGGRWTTLPPVTRTAQHDYPVVEVRSQLIRGAR